MNLRLKFWRFYPNPIRKYHFSAFRWVTKQTYRKLRDFLTVTQPVEIPDRIAILRRYNEELKSGKKENSTIAVVEEMIALDLTEVLRAEGVRVFPPVVFRLSDSPRFLVMSERNRIKRSGEYIVLDPSVNDGQMEEIESFVERIGNGIVPLVVPTGGVSLFPTIVRPQEFPMVAEVAGHEWCHHYLLMFRLGRSGLLSPSTRINNLVENTCTLVGEELEELVRQKYGWEENQPVQMPEGALNFHQMMRETREAVDRLLAAGKVGEAEAQMRVRQGLLNNFWKIRKLNQAYFSFYGSYGRPESGADPTARQLRELLEKTGSLKEFLKMIRGVGSDQDFEQLMEKMNIS